MKFIGRVALMKEFNVTGACNPEKHYMVDNSKRLSEIKKLVDKGDYFTINRARQYGKTTILRELCNYLKDDYFVVFMDFQTQMSNAKFQSENTFSIALAKSFLRIYDDVCNDYTDDLSEKINELKIEISNNKEEVDLVELFLYLSEICRTSVKPIVLIVDEVDSATNNQVFLDFLAQLRGYYLDRDNTPIFQSVILAGVYDVKNIKRKIRSDDEKKVNSPWNIAVDFEVDMSFSKDDIKGMLAEYKNEKKMDMDVDKISGLIHDYTSGYPFLVSRICQILDKEIKQPYAWTEKGVLETVNKILMEKNTLFESLMGKVTDYPELKNILYSILFSGEKIVYNPDDPDIDIASMFGFVKNNNGSVAISNRIFEIRLYNYFLTTAEARNSEIFKAGSNNKNQFIEQGHLNMDKVLEKYVEYFDEIYGDNVETFDEKEGRRRFLLYIRPIINGTGNYYIEAETRNSRRMDVVVDYSGERFVIELKIWRGNAYNERGEQQLSEYLDYFKIKKGYMLSYNFNAKKEIGVTKITVGDRVIVEAVV
jgi:hypothetical protein